MAVSVVEEVVQEPRLRLVPPDDVAPAPEPTQKSERPTVQWVFPTSETISVLAAISAIIAVRFILLVAVCIGGFIGLIAMKNASVFALVGAGLYYVGVIVPMALLAWNWKKG